MAKIRGKTGFLPMSALDKRRKMLILQKSREMIQSWIKTCSVIDPVGFTSTTPLQLWVDVLLGRTGASMPVMGRVSFCPATG